MKRHDWIEGNTGGKKEPKRIVWRFFWKPIELWKSWKAAEGKESRWGYQQVVEWKRTFMDPKYRLKGTAPAEAFEERWVLHRWVTEDDKEGNII